MKSKDPLTNFNEYDEENMFNNINLLNNPLSNDSNNMIQQIKINNSARTININANSDSNINLIIPNNNNNNNTEVNRQPSYQGNAIRLEDLPNLPEAEYDGMSDQHKTNLSHSHNDSVQTLAITTSISKHNGGYIHMGDSSANYHHSPSIDNNKFCLYAIPQRPQKHYYRNTSVHKTETGTGTGTKSE